MYLYDINPSCNENDIVSSLNYLSSTTGIKFIRVPPPFALLLGGIDYSCGYVSSSGAIGESETGMVSASIIAFTWDNIHLLDSSRVVIVHETLHSLGFAHSNDRSSIMYPIGGSDPHIDPDIIEFLKTYYANNPFAYLNILTLNMIVGTALSLVLIAGGAALLFKR